MTRPYGSSGDCMNVTDICSICTGCNSGSVWGGVLVGDIEKKFFEVELCSLICYSLYVMHNVLL